MCFSGALALTWGCGIDPDPLPQVASASLNSDPNTGAGSQPDLLNLVGDPSVTNPNALTNGNTCLGEAREAEVVSFDLFVMLDTSASMLDTLPESNRASGLSGQTKWDAVRASIAQFVQADDTRDIGIGLQYFPQVFDGVPTQCTTNEVCGVASPCSNSVCTAQVELEREDEDSVFYLSVDPASVVNCAEDAQCGDNEVCRALVGECVYPGDIDPQYFDFPTTLSVSTGLSIVPRCADASDCLGMPGSQCEVLGVCSESAQLCSLQSFSCSENAGACEPFFNYCMGVTRCEAEDYAQPAVSIRRDLQRSEAIISSMYRQNPTGTTPTAPALAGGLQHARQWAQSNPGREVVTVLVTDGFPTECSPRDSTEIAAIAQTGASGEQGVRTFVIGVFSARDLNAEGRESLDEIAAAGGTGRAFLVDTNANLAEEFLAALDQIRRTAVSCDFQLNAGMGIELDLNRVNLQTTSPSGVTTPVDSVSDAAACGEEGGWFYLRDATGEPTQIRVCPTTCTALTNGTVRADLQVGCATRIR